MQTRSSRLLRSTLVQVCELGSEAAIVMNVSHFYVHCSGWEWHDRLVAVLPFVHPGFNYQCQVT